MGYYPDGFSLAKVTQFGPELLRGRYVLYLTGSVLDKESRLRVKALLWCDKLEGWIFSPHLQALAPDEAARVFHLLNVSDPTMEPYASLYQEGHYVRQDYREMRKWAEKTAGQTCIDPLFCPNQDHYAAALHASQPELFTKAKADRLARRWARVSNAKTALDELEAQALA